MKTLITTFSLTIAILFANINFSSSKDKTTRVCSNEDQEYAKFWNNYYDPEDAHKFGEEIKKLVGDKNLEGLFNLVDGELKTGPRKGFIKDKKFSDIFSEKWRNGVLASASPCSPVGWRGFMLDQGSIWYNKDKERDKWHVFSILGTNKEEPAENKMPVGWKINGKILPPQCFSTLWMSGDNYEDFADKFAIRDYEHFSKNPGLYFGKEIPKFDSIVSSWDSEIYLATSLKKCFGGILRFGGVKNIGFPEIQIDKKSVKTKICSSTEVCTHFEYTILEEIASDECQTLAPHVEAKCLGSYLISIGDYSGGTMGWDMSHNIYGLFALNNNQKYVIPLKNFDKKNDAINYVKQIN